jgi:hypothetical protein
MLIKYNFIYYSCTSRADSEINFTHANQMPISDSAEIDPIKEINPGTNQSKKALYTVKRS